MLTKIRSVFILKQIFEYTRKTRKLLIVHKNDYLIKKLEITPNDFKEASEIIEITYLIKKIYFIIKLFLKYNLIIFNIM